MPEQVVSSTDCRGRHSAPPARCNGHAEGSRVHFFTYLTTTRQQMPIARFGRFQTSTLNPNIGPLLFAS